jgi:hypothetical protein
MASTPTAFVPAKIANEMTGSGNPAGQAEGVKFLQMENNAAAQAIGSSPYRIQSALPRTGK